MNKTLFKQADSRWGSKPYPSKGSSFAGNGCGCVACTHLIIENQQYKSLTPEPVRQWMVKQGYAVVNQGTRWRGIPATLKHYGYSKVVHIDRDDPMTDAWKELNKGNRIGVILFKPVVRIWLRKDLAYQNGLIPLMCCFYILYSILNIECQFLNGMNSIKVQTILYVFSGVLNVPFSILLGVVFNLQSVGIRLATFILVLIMDVVLGIDLKNKLSSMKREVHEL